jgi:hypothetical protein
MRRWLANRNQLAGAEEEWELGGHARAVAGVVRLHCDGHSPTRIARRAAADAAALVLALALAGCQAAGARGAGRRSLPSVRLYVRPSVRKGAHQQLRSHPRVRGAGNQAPTEGGDTVVLWYGKGGGSTRTELMRKGESKPRGVNPELEAGARER